MNIALYHNLPSGGARRAMFEIVKGLVARGHTVDEYCPETADLAFLPLDGVVRRTVVLPCRLRGVARARIPLLTPYVTAFRLAADLRAMAAVGYKAARQIEQHDYDLVFTHDCQHVLVPDVIRFLQRPTVHYFHYRICASNRNTHDLRSTKSFLDGIKQFYYAPARQIYPWLRFRQARRNVHAAGHVLINSHFAATELQTAFGAPAQVCYLGVDTAQFRPLGLVREPFLLSVGAIHYHKGYRFLLQALAKLPKARRLPLVIAANSVEPAELHELRALAAGLEVCFTVQSVADAAGMAALYNRAAAFVYTPLCEPWGLAAVEAMACGTAVVAIDEGGIRESVLHNETGLLTSRVTDAFAAALDRVLSDPSLASRLGAGGVARVRDRFTWAKTVDQLEPILLKSQLR